MAKRANTVPEGRIGTGAAVVYGPNTALRDFVRRSEENQQRLIAGQERYMQTQNEYNKNFNKSLIDMQELANTPMFQEDFANLTNELVEQGSQLMAQGINPYNPNQTPNARAAVQQWSSEVAKLKNAKALVDNLYKDRQKQVQKYRDDPMSYDLESHKEFMDFENNFNLEDVLNGVQIPELSKVLNIGQEAAKQYGDVYKDIADYGVDADGRPVYTEQRVADEQRIINIADQEIDNPNSPYGREVDRRLRKSFGDNFDRRYLLGTTDKGEIRSMIDGQLRMPTDDNPLIELIAKGREVSPGTKGYEKMLDDITEDWVKAEKLVLDSKQEIVDAITGRTNTREKVKLDYAAANEVRRQEAHRSRMYTDSLRRENLRSSTNKNNRDVSDFSSPGQSSLSFFNGNEQVVEAYVRNSRNITTNMTVSTPNVYNLNQDGVKEKSGAAMSGTVSRFVEVPMTIQGGKEKVMSGKYAEENPDKVRWKKMARFSVKEDGFTEDYLIPIESVKENLTKRDQEIYDQFMKSSPSKGAKKENKKSTGKFDDL